MLLTIYRKRKLNCLYSISIILNMMSAPQGHRIDKPPSILHIQRQTSSYILNDHLCPSHFSLSFFVSYSIIHIHIPLSSECENESEKEILDRSIVSLYCHHFLLYIYICSRRENKLTKHSLGTRRQTSTIEQVVRAKNYLDTRQ